MLPFPNQFGILWDITIRSIVKTFLFYHNHLFISTKITPQNLIQSVTILLYLYYTTLNIFCDIGFSFFFSISACAFRNSSIRFSSSLASSNPIYVYTFIVTLMSECPMRYCSVFGFIPDFAIFEQ